MKIAILDADTLYDNLRPRYGSYGAMFEQLLGPVTDDWQMDIYRVIDGQYPEDPNLYDGFLITGSKYDSFADDDWIVALRQYARELFRQDQPMVGVCFGHQLLAHALGGRAGRSDAGWGLGVMQYRVEQRPAFVGESTAVNLIASHRDQVLELPTGAQRLLSSDFCPNAAFYIPGKVLAIQGHPEFSVDYARALLNHRAGQWSPEKVAQVESSFAQSHDGSLVAQWIRRFLQQETDNNKEEQDHV
jgi:GMP synthase-like glutamine amidotransferase